MAKTKKIFPILILIGILLTVFPLNTDAGTYFLKTGEKVEYEGFVPCGKNVSVDGSQKFIGCQLCHLFVMIDGILDFIFSTLIPPLFILLMVIGGAMIVFSGGNQEWASKGKSIVTTTIIGLVIIFSAFIVIEIVLSALGVVEIGEGVNPSEWFKVKCQIDSSTLSD